MRLIPSCAALVFLVFGTACSEVDGVAPPVPKPEVNTDDRGSVEVAPRRVSFGAAAPGESVARTFRLTNNSAHPAQVFVGRSSQSEFVSEQSGSFTIAAGETMAVDVAFTGNELGAYLASIDVEACAGGCRTTVELTAAVGSDKIRCEPYLDFGSVGIDSCANGTLRCTNDHLQREMFSIEVSSNVDSDVSIVGPIPTSIGPRDSTDVHLSFCPSELGGYESQLLVGAQEIRVTAFVLGPQKLKCDPTSLDFIDIPRGARQTVRCENQGLSPITITELAIEGGFSAYGAPVTVAPFATAGIDVEVWQNAPVSTQGDLSIITDHLETGTVLIYLREIR
jgi:hypothetical protein